MPVKMDEDSMHPTALFQSDPPADMLPTLQTSFEPYSSTDDEEDDHLEHDFTDDDEENEAHDTFNADLPDFSMVSYNLGRRTSVSAESMTPSRDKKSYVRTVIPKTEEQQKRIELAISNNFLFKNLDEIQYRDVINAMAEKTVVENENVIQQGAIGDYFYIVEYGSFECYISQNGAPATHVASYGPGGSFGELALMYNSPRAATITATSPGVLWALDRVTFRRILMENTAQRRYMYETFLAEVPILASLDAYERHKIADALETVIFQDGETVIEQGTVGENFYLIESGEAAFYKLDPQDGLQKEVNCLGKGAYFGGNCCIGFYQKGVVTDENIPILELALINDSPRAATVVARGRLRCATLGKRGFKRLLGPIMDILKRNSENYARIMSACE